jgi:hypothetical protein
MPRSASRYCGSALFCDPKTCTKKMPSIALYNILQLQPKVWISKMLFLVPLFPKGAGLTEGSRSAS